MTVAFRPAEFRDRAFVLDSWLASYRNSHTAGLVGMRDWFAVMWPVLAKLLDRPQTTTIVAYDPDEVAGLTDLRGWIAADVSPGPPLVLYVFVKEADRRAGLARRLFRAVGVDPEKPFLFACKTAPVAELMRARKLPLARFNPLAARYDSKVKTNHERPEPEIEILRARR